MDESLRHRRVLGIVGSTGDADIRRRHRELMKRYHPDRAPGGREREFLLRAQELNAAREWLLLHPASWVAQAPFASIELEPEMKTTTSRVAAQNRASAGFAVVAYAAGWVLKAMVVLYVLAWALQLVLLLAAILGM